MRVDAAPGPAADAMAGSDGTSLGAFGHRPALDGLRTVAVYLVVLFHADVALFGGGFIGVDLFFVLSGFLVTNVLLTEIDTNHGIRLWRFYARRARRLIPAATATIAGTSLLMLLVANPIDRVTVLADARASSLWFANWHFLAESGDYFAGDDNVSPFLHFWSLAVEEQFYLAYPIVLLLVWLLARRVMSRLPAALATLTVAGVVVQIVVAGVEVNAGYYATHARLYQLLAGATVAAYLRIRGPSRILRGMGWSAGLVGLAGLVIAATPVVDLAPSGRGLLAAAVSTILIVGLETRPNTRLARGLSWEPVAYLGRISYGTYLWHWPLIVVARRVLDFGPWVGVLIAGVGGTALAALSNELLESPIRRSRWLGPRWRLSVGAGVATALIAGLVLAPALLDSDRPPAVRSQGASVDAGLVTIGLGPVPDLDFEAIRSERVMGPNCFRGEAAECVVVDGSGLRVHLTGDSHAGMLLPGLVRVAEANDWRLTATTINSCPWQVGLFAGDAGDDQSQTCARRRTVAYEDFIPDLEPDVIVAIGHPRGTDFGKGFFSDRPELADASRSELLEALTSPGIDMLQSLAPAVVIIETVPRPAEDQLACLSGARELDECVAAVDAVAVDDVILRSSVVGRSGVATVDLDLDICPDLPACVPLVGGEVVRRDAHHLSADFARALAPVLVQRLADTGLFQGGVRGPLEELPRRTTSPVRRASP